MQEGSLRITPSRFAGRGFLREIDVIEMLYSLTGIVFYVVPFVLVCVVLWAVCGPWLGGGLIALLLLSGVCSLLAT